MRNITRVALANTISPAGLALFPERYTTEVVDNHIPDGVAALLCRSANLHTIDFPPTLLAIGRAGAGVNTIPVAECTQQGIVVFNTPGANANAVAELTIALMIMAARNMGPAWDFAGDVLTSGDHGRVEREKKQYVGTELLGKTIAIIGLGAIGRRVAHFCAAFGMQVIGCDNDQESVVRTQELVKLALVTTDIGVAVAGADFVTIHAPHIKGAQPLITAEVIQRCKQGAILINAARKELVEEPAVLSALDNGSLRAYATDFPTCKHEKIVNMPHLGASTGEAEEKCATMVVQQVWDFIECGNIRNAVNFPDVYLPRRAGPRITVIHENCPGALSSITGWISTAQLNIADLVNKGEGKYAYTLIDLDRSNFQKVTEAIGYLESGVRGLVRVRVLK